MGHLWVLWIALAAIGFLLLMSIFKSLIVRGMKNHTLQKVLRQIEAQKLAARKYGDPVKGVSAQEEQRILTLKAHELLKEIKGGKLSSETAVRVFCKRALQCGDKYQCTADLHFQEAIQMAKEKDHLLHSNGKLAGPLHGLPVSVKDCFDLNGTHSTIGMATRYAKAAESDSVFVQMMKEAGAIPFVKTNDMQCLLGYESSNPVWGRVQNPWNIDRTSGGSSGGEAALIASYGSPLGIGTDIGGSIRMPSHFCGIFGFKPTGKRVSKIGQKGEGAFQEAIVDSAGPMARSVDDLLLLAKVLLSSRMNELDSMVPPLPWSEEIFSRNPKQLTFGYFNNDGFMQPFSACSRAVDITVEALKKNGCEVVEFEAPRVDEMLRMYLSLMSGDGFETLKEELKNDVIDPAINGLILLAGLPLWVNKLASTLLRNVFRQKKLGDALDAGDKTVFDAWQLQTQRLQYQRQFFEYWKSKGVDVLICPAMTTVAVPHRTSEKVPPVVLSYTSLFNLLDCPAGIVPVTYVNKRDVEAVRPVTDLIARMLKQCEGESAQGLPVGVQIVAMPFKDEMCLSAMNLVSDLLPFQLLPYESFGKK